MTTQTADTLLKAIKAPYLSELTFENVDGKFTKVRTMKSQIGDAHGAIVMDKNGDRHRVHVHNSQVVIAPDNAVTATIRPVGDINTHSESDWISIQPGQITVN